MSKQWKEHGLKPPVNKRLMLSLPPLLGDTRIYHDRGANIYWREVTCNGPSSWSYYIPPPRRRASLAKRIQRGEL